jgi:hypothetical protein
MTDKPDRPCHFMRMLARTVVALVAIYVLSVGPAFRVADRTGLIVIYRPLFWAIDNAPEPLRPAGVHYVQFWVDVTRPDPRQSQQHNAHPLPCRIPR